VQGGCESFNDNPRTGHFNNLLYYIDLKDLCQDCSKICSAGSFFDGEKCEICSAGSFLSIENKQEGCTLCPPGTFNPNIAAGSFKQCYPCPEGSFNNLSGQSYCFDCPALTDCPSGSLEPSLLVQKVQVDRINPRLYSSQSVEKKLLIVQLLISLSIALISFIIYYFWSRFHFLKKLDFFINYHNYRLNTLMMLKSNIFGVLFTLGFISFVLIFVITTFLEFAFKNIIEEKTLLPGPILNQEVKIFTAELFTLKIKLEQFGDVCSNDVIKISTFDIKFKEQSVKIESLSGRICEVILEFYECNFGTGSFIDISCSGSSSYASGFQLNLTTTSSIPNEISSIKTKLRSSKNKVLVGSTKSQFFYSLTPSLFRSEVSKWPSESTGFHISQEKSPVKGSELSILELSLASLLEIRVHLSINYSGLYTYRYMKNSIFFVIAAVLGTVFGVLAAFASGLRIFERGKRNFRARVFKVRFLRRIEKKGVEIVRNFEEFELGIEKCKEDRGDNYRLTLEF
jgi:hypothetical protein